MANSVQHLSIHNLPWPVDWAGVFGAARPLIVEIGFGRGAYLRHLSQKYPDSGIIGLEISNRCLQAAERMMAREGLYNVRVIHATAETALAHLFEPGTVSQIHINFPDPWFKTDHHHRRLMRAANVALLISRLRSGGALFLATDIQEYAELTDTLLSQAEGVENLLSQPWTHDMPGRTPTKYETTARREGRMCYYFAYRRTDAPVAHIPVNKELEMPHAVLHVPLSLPEIAARFDPIKTAREDVHLHLMEAFLGEASILVEAHIGEPTIRQHVMIGIYRYAGGAEVDTYTIQLSTIGQPRATLGAHLAVCLLRDWLLTLHPEVRLLHQKVQEQP
ncbi:MAG: tRNA (guanosine(46)-N7)-methyltransferase TrmB [Anaerolineae bacterium]|nr:tRNA (guanosine(46)-N7)-methyltransferase TrmB [Anaerolineae bacterium]NUQ03530.1 tRNA (guanosine(46)-N7)-methyltransferase TrmB [Anaerolineae bacterium]